MPRSTFLGLQSISLLCRPARGRRKPPALAVGLLTDGYPIPELQPAEARRMLGPRALSAPLRLWVGTVEGRPVSVASAYVGEEAVSVFMVATLPHARGK